MLLCVVRIFMKQTLSSRFEWLTFLQLILSLTLKIGCLLFPTVEHMITSPAGISLNRVLKYVPSLFMMSIVWLISCLPRSFLGNVVKLWLQFKLLNFNSSTPYLTDACLGATLDLINPRYVILIFLALAISKYVCFLCSDL